MQKLTIGSLVYDPADQCLWRGAERVELTPKTFALLACLVSRAGRLVTKEELLRTVWPDVCVTDAVLKARIAELRRRLGEVSGETRFIETLHRRGYRLVAPVSALGSAALVAPADSSGAMTRVDRHAPEGADGSSNEAHAESRDGEGEDEGKREDVEDGAKAGAGGGQLIGRELCLDRLLRHLDRAGAGERRLVFVTGEAGAGKSALLRTFLNRIERRADVRVASGQCVEHHGAQEAFLPVLDALDKLCRSDDDPTLAAALRRYAPTWLAQMPWLLEEGERAPLAEALLGATRTRMSRELGLFCEVTSRERVLVLVLEDLHWCDYATVELLAWLASRQGGTRLLLLVSLRPAESNALAHPIEALRRERSLRDPSSEIALDPLGASDIERYLRQRLPERREHGAPAAWLHRRTGGNPLFVVNLVTYLQERGLWSEFDSSPAPHAPPGAVEDVVPDSLRRMIAAQIERLEPRYQTLLLAASVAGDVFCAGVLSAALGEEAESLDESCRHLVASGQFIRHFDLSELPDGTCADRYAFVHVLYRDSLSQSLSARRRTRFHQAIGMHKARVYAGSTHLVAAQLVTHFAQAGNAPLAIRFLRESANTALARCANQAAVCHLTSALSLLAKVTDGPRTALEIALLEQRGLVHQAMADMAGAVSDFERLLQLARRSGDVASEVAALLRLASALSWSDRERCLLVVDEARGRCRHVEDDARRLSALGSCAYWNLLWRGWNERDAEDSLAAATSARREERSLRAGATLARTSYFLCLRGDYPRAADMAGEGMAIATENGDSSEYLLALYFRCWALLHGGRWDLFVECLDEQAFRIADSNDHRFWHLLFTLLRSWLEELCGDFEAARRSAADALARAERHDLPFGRLLGLVRLGFAYQGLGREREARDAFERCESWLSGERVLMDWIVSIPMHHGLSRHWLKTGELERAGAAARVALRLAEEPGERTYAAAALETLSSVAVATGDLAGAQAALDSAFETLAGADAPLVSWRLHAAAARLAETRDDARDAARHWSSGAGILEPLVAALGKHPVLRDAFERSPPVRAVLTRARETNRAVAVRNRCRSRDSGRGRTDAGRRVNRGEPI